MLKNSFPEPAWEESWNPYVIFNVNNLITMVLTFTVYDGTQVDPAHKSILKILMCDSGFGLYSPDKTTPDNRAELLKKSTL